MASSYALPVSALHHSHNGNHHTHSHSHSPRGHTANHSRSLNQERSNGSLHSHAQSESYLPHIHEHGHEHGHEHDHNHSHDREPSPYLPSPEKKTGHPSFSAFRDDTYEPAPLSYQHPLSINVHSHEAHGHGNHDHHHHSHGSATPVGPRSRFTSFLLPFVLRWPLLHTIMADKDSRRIFYFMRYRVCLN